MCGQNASGKCSGCGIRLNIPQLSHPALLKRVCEHAGLHHSVHPGLTTSPGEPLTHAALS